MCSDAICEKLVRYYVSRAEPSCRYDGESYHPSYRGGPRYDGEAFMTLSTSSGTTSESNALSLQDVALCDSESVSSWRSDQASDVFVECECPDPFDESLLDDLAQQFHEDNLSLVDLTALKAAAFGHTEHQSVPMDLPGRYFSLSELDLGSSASNFSHSTMDLDSPA
jgi:hypothetical protein